MVISLEPGVVIEAKRGEFHGFWDSMISFCGVSNVTLRGLAAVRGGPLANESDIATLKMHKEDYRNMSAYPEKSEWRMGIWIGACEALSWRPPNNSTTGIAVEHLRVESTGGDGIYLTTGARDVTIKGVDSASNFRQGMSVCDATNLWVEGCWFRDTEGTDPMAGVDLEPYDVVQKLHNISITNCFFENNQGSGFELVLSKLDQLSVKITNCTSRNNGVGASFKGPYSYGRAKGAVIVEDVQIEGSVVVPMVMMDVNTSAVDLRLCNISVNNSASATHAVWPLLGGKSLSLPSVLVVDMQTAHLAFGPVEMRDFRVQDAHARPWLGVYCSSGFPPGFSSWTEGTPPVNLTSCDAIGATWTRPRGEVSVQPAGSCAADVRLTGRPYGGASSLSPLNVSCEANH